jgi:hypothetical protein
MNDQTNANDHSRARSIETIERLKEQFLAQKQKDFAWNEELTDPARTKEKRVRFEIASELELVQNCLRSRCANDDVARESFIARDGEGVVMNDRDEIWSRPSLRTCTAKEFAYDFMKFHQDELGKYDYEQMWDKLDRIISKSGKPFDLLTFYGEICRLGGFQGDRVEAKRRISISKVYRAMFNYFDGHSYTDIGTKLMDAYEMFFCEYEKARPLDVRAFCSGAGAGAGAGSDTNNMNDDDDGSKKNREEEFYYLRERAQIEKEQIAVHLRRGRSYDPNYIPLFRASVDKKVLMEEIGRLREKYGPFVLDNNDYWVLKPADDSAEVAGEVAASEAPKPLESLL